MNGLEIKDIRGEGRVVHLSLEGGPDFSGMVYFY